MSGSSLVSLLLGGLWLAAGVVLLFDLGHLPLRAINRRRSRPVGPSAITPLYWRAWGAILIAAAVGITWFALRN